MDRAQKSELITGLAQTLSETSVIVVARNHGLTVAQVTDLRNKMRQAGASFKVTKNRLARLALAGTKFENLSDLLRGPTGLAFSTDPVAAAKVCSTYAKTNKKLVILGGNLDGQKMDTAAVETLASLPSLNELRGKIIGLIQAPATKIAGVLAAPGAQIARVLAAKAKQGEAA